MKKEMNAFGNEIPVVTSDDILNDMSNQIAQMFLDYPRSTLTLNTGAKDNAYASSIHKTYSLNEDGFKGETWKRIQKSIAQAINTVNNARGEKGMSFGYSILVSNSFDKVEFTYEIS